VQGSEQVQSNGLLLEIRFLLAAHKTMDDFKKSSLLYQLRKELSYIEWNKLDLKNLESLRQEVEEQIEALTKNKRK
jgi:hypothetical protein